MGLFYGETILFLNILLFLMYKRYNWMKSYLFRVKNINIFEYEVFEEENIVA